ncbi:hypothetical protein CDO52_13325 [Nocardiopsis gilva YIM 90087]|uniref:Uncharacterized protein n=1 Tax=Nocardiopsis gilva YIM 90087 TaxID=1235441 RepID=A0A223S691_9ACTN|nr:hypothetical protein [Nocardiopsis gilva]ASU83640.1 hypothetical protein CDO52_13325 [Nocardiopsis gilva YIM 90087]
MSNGIDMHMKCSDGQVAIGFTANRLDDWDWFALYEGGVDPFNWAQGLVPAGNYESFGKAVVSSVANLSPIPNWAWAMYKTEIMTTKSEGDLKAVYWSWGYEQKRYYIMSSNEQQMNCSTQ